MSPVAEPKVVPRFKERYVNEIRPALVERFGYETPMRAPRIRKITLNMGVGDAKQDTAMLEAATEQLAVIAGQRPNVRRARKSIANSDEEAFALLEAFGMPFRRDGRPGAEDTEAAAAADEERRKEARARAEAEQAALEQLKAENPEAYERREKPEEGEEGEGGE